MVLIRWIESGKSGKTHTMSGTREDIGVIPLAISSVFQAIEEVSKACI